MLIAISSLARQLLTGAAGMGSSLEGLEVSVAPEHTAQQSLWLGEAYGSLWGVQGPQEELPGFSSCSWQLQWSSVTSEEPEPGELL